MNKSGYLNVGDGHQLYYETHGNPRGIPVLYLHGGPGYGFSERDKRHFDPDIFHAILFEQRGASRSIPYGSLENNTSQKLVEDIDKILDFFSVEQTLLFGGSWGSTLALLYSIANPSRVKGMVLRGIFPATVDGIRHYTQGPIGLYYPEAWERFVALVPEDQRKDVAAYCLKQIQSADKETSDTFAFEWTYYGFCVSRKVLPWTEEQITTLIKSGSYQAHALMEAWYSVHNFFIPDHYIYDNLHKITHIPTSIIHGRFDVICPPVFAHKLHQGLAHSRLFFVDAGHSSSEPEIEIMLKSELLRLAALS